VADPSWGEPRSRTVTWYDPMQVAAAGLSMSGLQLLEAVRDGVLPPPPISQLFQMGVNAVEPGRVEFTCELDESAYNPIGVVHGGLVCTLLDTVVGCAVHSTLPGRQRLHLHRDQGQLPACRPRHERAARRASARW
jgi:hypothetical protein